MTNKLIIAAATVLSVAVFSPLGAMADAQQPGSMGQNAQSRMMNKQGHGSNSGMGSGPMMKKSGMGMGQMMKMRKMMMGKMFMVRKKPYSNADIRRMIDGRLARHGFSKLMASEVIDGSEKMSGSAIVPVVSAKGELLFKVEVNRNNGMAAIVE